MKYIILFIIFIVSASEMSGTIDSLIEYYCNTYHDNKAYIVQVVGSMIPLICWIIKFIIS